MSRLNPTVKNPTTRWFEWDAENGNLKYYDKEQEENVPVKLPFTFLLLDELAKITGWSDKREASIYSNEVHSTVREYLHVQCNQTTIAEGKYGGIKEQVEREGGRYTSSLYIAYKNDSGELVIGNLALKGGALPSWIDFGKEVEQLKYKEAIQIKKSREESFTNKDGEEISYRVPVFNLKEVSEDTHEKALDLNRDLEDYFDSRPDYSQETNGQEQSEPAEQPADSSVDLNQNFDDIDDDLPF